MTVLIDGKFFDQKQASIPITDRGFLFGDGIFTTLKVSNGTIEHLADHLSYLQAQCSSIFLACPQISPALLSELVTRNNALQNIWRLKIIVTGGDDPSLHLSPRQGRWIATIKPILNTPPEEARLCIYPIPFSSPLANVKNLSYLNRLYLSSYALQQQCDEVLIFSTEGHILETAFANIFWHDKGTLFTPASPHLLLGTTVTRLSPTFVTKRLDEIDPKAQLFLCNSIQGIVPIVQIADRTFLRDFALEAALRNRL